MMGGIIAATILTLTFLPALYALAFRIHPKAQSMDGPDLKSVTEPALQAAE